MARTLSNKQRKFLTDFVKSQVLSESDRFLYGGAPFRGGVHMLSCENLSDGQWMDLASMNDYETLWQDANRFLSDESIKKSNR